MSKTSKYAAGVMCLISVLFIGSAQAQNVNQAELCSLETNFAKAEGQIAAAIRTESNPLKKTDLSQQLSNLQDANYKAHLAYFNAEYGIIGRNTIVNLKGEKPFVGLSGKLRKFESRGGGDYGVEVLLDCPQPRPFIFAFIGQTNNITRGDPTISEIAPLQQSLKEIGLGNNVEVSGVVVMVYGQSPSVRPTETLYWGRISRISKK